MRVFQHGRLIGGPVTGFIPKLGMCYRSDAMAFDPQTALQAGATVVSSLTALTSVGLAYQTVMLAARDAADRRAHEKRISMAHLIIAHDVLVELQGMRSYGDPFRIENVRKRLDVIPIEQVRSTPGVQAILKLRSALNEIKKGLTGTSYMRIKADLGLAERYLEEAWKG